MLSAASITSQCVELRMWRWSVRSCKKSSYDERHYRCGAILDLELSQNSLYVLFYRAHTRTTDDADFPVRLAFRQPRGDLRLAGGQVGADAGTSRDSPVA